jgi:hypothetical protein
MIHEKKGAAYRDGIPFFDFRLQSFDVDFRKNCCRLAARPADSSLMKSSMLRDAKAKYKYL